MRAALLLPVLAAAMASSACPDGRGELLAVVQAGKYGFIDHAGRVVIPPQFVWADDFWRGLGTVYVCGHYASIDSSGTVVPLRGAVPGHLEPQREGEKYGFVNEHGQFAITPSFDDVLPFREGLAAAKVGEQWGFIDNRGNWAIQPQFAAAYYFREGVATADSGSSTVLIDKTGRVLASGYEFLTGIVSHGRVPATKDGKGGYLDLQGRVAIPLVYDSITTFSNGLAAVEQAGKWGYVDPDGRVVIPFAFDSAAEFGSGLAPVRLGSRTGFINRSGTFAFDLPFREAPGGFLTGDKEDNILSADSDVSRFWTSDDKFGYVNTSGLVIWGPADEGPGHRALFGWSDEEKAESCKGVSAP